MAVHLGSGRRGGAVRDPQNRLGAHACSHQPLYIDKAITIRGETDASGDPLTVVTGLASGELSSLGGFFTPLNRKSTIRDILFNGIWYADRGTNTLPFVTAGIGASIFAAEGADSETRFAWMFGAGIRQDMSEKAGIRLGIRWMPMWVSTGTGVFCDPFFCYATDTGESYDQWEVNGGLVFKLGGQ